MTMTDSLRPSPVFLSLLKGCCKERIKEFKFLGKLKGLLTLCTRDTLTLKQTVKLTEFKDNEGKKLPFKILLADVL